MGEFGFAIFAHLVLPSNISEVRFENIYCFGHILLGRIRRNIPNVIGLLPYASFKELGKL